MQSTTNHAWSMVHRAPPDHLHRRNKRRGPTPTRPQLASLPAAAAPDHHFHSARAPAPLPRHMPPGVRDHLICCPVVVWWAPRARRDGRVPVFRRGAPRGRTGAAWHPVFRAPSRGGGCGAALTCGSRGGFFSPGGDRIPRHRPGSCADASSPSARRLLFRFGAFTAARRSRCRLRLSVSAAATPTAPSFHCSRAVARGPRSWIL